MFLSMLAQHCSMECHIDSFVLYAGCHFMMSIVLLSVKNKTYILSVIRLNVTMLDVTMLSFVMLNGVMLSHLSLC
jgi:hypothetical protein